jgi:type VI secretion system secreted protein VgrG
MSDAGPPPFEIHVDGFADGFFRVRSFEGRETISDTYAFDVVVTAHAHGGDEVERLALGSRAVLILHVGKGPRAFHGVLSAVRLDGVHEADGALKYRLRLVPRLWLLKRKQRTRIFQNMRVTDVVTTVLQEAGIAAKWQLMRPYPAREYVTQYEESDYRFVTRLLAEAGMYFYFPAGPPVDAGTMAAATAAGAAATVASDAIGAVAGAAAGAFAGGIAAEALPVIPGDTVVCGDDAAFYPILGGDDAAELMAAGLAALAPEAANLIGGEVAGTVAGFAGAAAGAAIAAATAKSAPPLRYASSLEMAHSHVDRISAFGLRTSVRSNAANFREYDPERPMIRLIGAAVSTAPFPPTPEQAAAGVAYAAGAMAQNIASLQVGGQVGGPLGGAAGAVASVAATVANVVDDVLGQAAPTALLETYDHHGPFLFPKWGFAADEAPRILRQKRRHAAVADGRSGCPDLAPGHRFALRDHPASQLDRDYAVISVEHRGEAHPQQPGSSWTVYQNGFSCVPAEQTYVPPRPKRKSVQVALTATVVGPPGEEIYVDPMGQIKVQFHWDRAGKFDDKSSCWIRTMQPWGGAGWGVQFIPRVGMEVVVTFEGGDPDKPLVLGSIYNGTHPSPFVLPQDRTRSGWRTQSSPGGRGFNELSFEDAAAAEQIYMHAQRDHDEVVERDHTAKIGNDERISVKRERTHTVGGDHHLTTKQVKREVVEKDSHLVVEGSLREKVTGVVSRQSQGLQLKVEGKHGMEVGDEIHLKAGSSIVIEAPDVTIKGGGGFIRVDGGGVTIVGSLVRINSGGSPGSGSGAQPEAPEPARPAELDDDPPPEQGEVK